MVSISNLFNLSDRVQMESLNHRLKRNQVTNTNIANEETPGYRAIAYDFERQLQSLYDANDPKNLKTLNTNHMVNEYTQADATVKPNVYIQPQESISGDGNTVDVDKEMGTLAKNQILYRTAVETINRKIALLKYAISGGR